MKIESQEHEDFEHMRAYIRLKNAINKMAENGYEDYAEDFYQESKGYYNLINMSEDEMIDHFTRDFKKFVNNYDQ